MIQGSKWQLLFSTMEDGFSLHSLYRKAALVDSLVLLIVQVQYLLLSFYVALFLCNFVDPDRKNDKLEMIYSGVKFRLWIRLQK
jgi:hypothetical protein